MIGQQAKRLLAGAVSMALIGTLAGCGPSMPETVKSSTPVETETVSVSSISTRNQLSGKVVPQNAVSLFAPQQSDVLTVDVAVGDRVTIGKTLFTLDAVSIQRDIQQVEGERSRTASLYDQQISQAQQQLETTRTLQNEQVRQAKQSWENTQALFEQEAASQIELEQAEAKYNEVKLSAEDTIYAAELSVTKLQTEKANQLATYDKSLAELRDSKGDMSVKSTVSGTVTEVNVVKGGKANTQTAAVVIATDETPQVSLSVSETIQPWLEIGDVVTVEISALGGQPITATIASVAPAVNEQTHLYDVLLDLPKDTGAAYGMFATVTIYTDVREDVVVIPTDAIQTDSTSQYIFIVEYDDTVTRIDIESGLVGDGVTQVTNGLTGGEDLVVAGQSYLTEGAEVRVVKRDGVDLTEQPAEPEDAPAEAEPAEMEVPE
ncbi:efflux RND transporter periplasmic adaptor subunit [Butyricicoccus faecihominis]|uniref:efflux RND transporter periplasmic adaptor subunit n=1 Tax=Butyricicoccaceae TaxID=3085642 RepID=UPI0024784022|nr:MULTISPECIES: efflux RND transporter periplasmic adaptor subunit [Butyricicoccaceae]MCQ5130069.1 efflux RND transporter periplasmic adaptor subunit [Butyricicoccus faecihominis]WNX85480.1 efflux RND transporter periplasmic adaptor subunit [Agathobaculum sp. NTUH-O15-33]